jgi:hypothetical protein
MPHIVYSIYNNRIQTCLLPPNSILLIQINQSYFQLDFLDLGIEKE